MSQLSFLLPENTVRVSLEYEHWRSVWKCFTLVDFKIERKWYLGEGKTPQEATNACTANMLSGKSLDTFYHETPPSVTKGSMAIERIKHKKEQEKKPLSEIF